MLGWKPAASSGKHRLLSHMGASVPLPPRPSPPSRLWELHLGWGSREEVKSNNFWVIDYKKASPEEMKP